METIIEKINDTKDLKKLNLLEKEILAKEYREKIIEVVSKNGGHLASNLGVVELTIALHSVFDIGVDKVIWDVGHQTYTHKMLTGRKKEFETLRQKNGLAGFPKISESKQDVFNTGHSSTSISAALGIAKARDIKQEDYHVIAVIGDGALTGGMALEALNDAGNSNTRLIVILNDNEMSISKNVGGIAMFLGKLRTRKFYTNSNRKIKMWVKKIPYLGEKIVQSIRKIKHSIKHMVISNMLFEDMGFKYFGSIDGHDIERLEGIFKIVKKVNGPVLVHIVTKKGKGYLPAEENPDQFHGVGSFDRQTGKTLISKSKDYSTVFGETLIRLAKEDKRIVAITAAMRDGTGLKKFSEVYPERFFDVGIAEQHAVCFAAGLATQGLRPVISIYSSFYQRAYDQIIHDVCMQNLPVIMCSDRAGIVGQDGETHQGILDLSFTSIIPNLTVMAPKDFLELEQMLEFAVHLDSPVYLRYPRGREGKNTFERHDILEYGKAEIIKQGTDISIIAIGKMVERGKQVSNRLEEEKISCELINIRFLSPIDRETIIQSILKTKQVITIEDNLLEGGLASKIKEIIQEEQLICKIKCFGYPKKYIGHAKVEEIEKDYGLDVDTIIKKSKEEFIQEEERNEQTRDFETV